MTDSTFNAQDYFRDKRDKREEYERELTWERNERYWAAMDAQEHIDDPTDEQLN